MANEGVNYLARALQTRMSRTASTPPALDFGVINADMSLTTNYFPLPIPQSDYVVCRSVQLGAADHILYKTQYTGLVNSGEHLHGSNGEHPHGHSGVHGGHLPEESLHDHPDTEGAHTHVAEGQEMQHVHDYLVGYKLRWLTPGDRVLVAWVGDDAVVIDIIYPAARVGREADSYEPDAG